MSFDDSWKLRDYRRQRVIERVMMEGDEILLRECDGSVEELHYLTVKIAQRWMEKVVVIQTSAMLKQDLRGSDIVKETDQMEVERANARKNDP